MTVETRVRSFIVDELRPDVPDAELTDDTPLITSGLIDSLSLYELVTLLEAEYAIEVADDEVLPANFGSIGAIARFVATKRQGVRR